MISWLKDKYNSLRSKIDIMYQSIFNNRGTANVPSMELKETIVSIKEDLNHAEQSVSTRNSKIEQFCNTFAIEIELDSMRDKLKEKKQRLSEIKKDGKKIKHQKIYSNNSRRRVRV